MRLGKGKCLSTIDIDLEELTELERLFFALRLRWLCTRDSIECRVYETSRGYHVYIYYPCKSYDFYDSLVLRILLYDDALRRDIDELRWKRGLKRWVETLFKFKRLRFRGRTVKVSVEKPVDLEQVVSELL